MSPLGPTLETERLILRPPGPEDFEAWAAMMADPEVAGFIGGVAPRAIAWRGLAAVIGAWTLRGYSMWSVIEKSSGRWIGRIGPWMPDGWPAPEVGYALVRDAWGQGYAVEAAQVSIDYAFEQLGWDEVTHVIDPANTASQAVAARVGSRWLREAVLPPPFNSTLGLWGQSRADWAARRG